MPMLNPDCPECHTKMDAVGGFNEIDYVECPSCGWYGDSWVENGVTYLIPVPCKNGHRNAGGDAYRQKVEEIAKAASAAA